VGEFGWGTEVVCDNALRAAHKDQRHFDVAGDPSVTCVVSKPGGWFCFAKAHSHAQVDWEEARRGLSRTDRSPFGLGPFICLQPQAAYPIELARSCPGLGGLFEFAWEAKPLDYFVMALSDFLGKTMTITPPIGDRNNDDVYCHLERRRPAHSRSFGWVAGSCRREWSKEFYLGGLHARLGVRRLNSVGVTAIPKKLAAIRRLSYFGLAWFSIWLARPGMALGGLFLTALRFIIFLFRCPLDDPRTSPRCARNSEAALRRW